MREQLCQLPKIDKILKEPCFKAKNPSLLKQIAQEQIHLLRQKLLTNLPLPPYEDILTAIETAYENLLTPSLKPIINATGVIIQTNLGRSVFSPKLLDGIFPLLCEYNNLEYDLQMGQRSERYEHIKQSICALLGCEDALIVNNNASAVLLIANTFAKNKEIIISRGELVEIGGSFRIPEVIVSAGGILKEVGTTNKTHLKDYQNAISSDSAMIMKVHQSNFKQIGFTKEVLFEDLSALAKKHELVDYYDVGSGFIAPFAGIDEPSLQEIASKNPSLVSFSGDKLLGGPQAGIIFGKKHLIDQLKKNHLLRALRVDKFSIFALSAIFRAYLENDVESIPTLQMIRQSEEELLAKAKQLAELLSPLPNLCCEIIALSSKAGGGALSAQEFPSYGVALTIPPIKPQILHTKMRLKGLVGRIQNNKIILDTRCLQPHHFKQIQDIFAEIIDEENNAKSPIKNA
ncbi:L-seryl-tRNA(Sec) selenium transferase [Helicobacter sp. 11S02596-1]|uniref:L-seryl-tRNA(Sec) selenium transferase n=1 Tax=Helicobacter sp. 11S02596-1 TaxID=1476194 RepID=UPI000BCF1BEC|nr:L-seryl-tRNA(Sec) selenium transferase [Helicobacter sp. 11S02596-1]PAF42514.1 L-seryl-tRNA(Sec) selenium transferase [Helicobacter sp. 11S02596-1]